MHLARLVYYSENRLDPSDGSVLSSLQAILRTSKANNGRRGITGALGFDSLWFLQVLEGERETVWSTFSTIMDDSRHGDVTLAALQPIETRCFGEWSMRLLIRSPESDRFFEPFTVNGILRPGLMSNGDIVDALVGMIQLGDKPRARVSSVGKARDRDSVPGAAPVAP